MFICKQKAKYDPSPDTKLGPGHAWAMALCYEICSSWVGWAWAQAIASAYPCWLVFSWAASPVHHWHITRTICTYWRNEQHVDMSGVWALHRRITHAHGAMWCGGLSMQSTLIYIYIYSLYFKTHMRVIWQLHI